MTRSTARRASGRRGLNFAIAAVLALTAFAGCGGNDEPAPAIGPLAAALDDLGGGGDGTIGVSWVDPELVRESGGGPALMAEALGPNARTLIEAAPRLRARFGLDPLAAERLVAVGGSYAFGLRLDGVDGRGLASELVADGGRERRSGDLQLIEIGDYAVVPDALRDVGVSGLGAFDALGARLAVLAISDRARASLLGESEPLLDEPIYRAAVVCLGDVVAARLLPDQHLISADLGITLVGVGVTADSEVVCAVGGTPERSEEIAEALETGLAPAARDPITRERIDRSLTAAKVERAAYEGVETVRAELGLSPAEQRGYVFGALARGSLVGLINGASRTLVGG